MATEVIKVIDPDMGSGYDYDSLYDWEAAQQGDLTGVRDEIAVAKCRCTGGTADTTEVTIDGWTTSVTQYIKIWTDPDESYRPSFSGWPTGNKYRFEHTETTSALTVSDIYVRLEGIYIVVSSGDSTAYGINMTGGSSGGTLIKNCMIRNTSADSGSAGIFHPNTGEVAPIYIINTIVCGPWEWGIYVRGYDATSRSIVYNCTAYGCYVGFRARDNYCIAKNCLAVGCTDAYLESSAYEVADYNAYDEGTDPGTNGVDVSGYTDAQIFVDAANGNFHLAASSPLIGVGANLYNDSYYPFQTDIDGNDRGGSGAQWDIGADEYVVTGGGSEGTVWGHENPTGYTEESWSTWKTSAGGNAVVDGDADWGKLNLTSTNHYGPVKDTGNSRGKRFVVKRDSFGTGLGTVTISIRGSTTSFAASDGSPSWEVYSTPINRVWRYVQVKAEKV